MAGSANKTAIVTRSVVKPSRNYSDYRHFLRADFWYSCAYCTLTELEAAGIRFEIEHYEPQRVRPDLVAEYANLLWSCDRCNRLKGDFCPSPEERTAGLRFFRPDEDDAYEHFEVAGQNLKPQTKVGEFTIELLWLNKLMLREVREMRRELFEANQEIMVGIRALQGIALDQLRPPVRARFLQIRRQFEREAVALGNGQCDELLREFNRSLMLDPDPDAEKRAAARRQYLNNQKALLAP